MQRRAFLSGSILSLAVTGCLSDRPRRETASAAAPSETAGAAAPSETASAAAPTETAGATTTASAATTTTTPATPSDTATQTAELTPETILPPPGDGWTRDRTDGADWRYLGGTDGIRGYYTSPDGVAFQAVVMRARRTSPAQIARNWHCVGRWSVAVAVREFVVAASSGTKQKRQTPDFAPWMSGTPHPGTDDDARALLVRSPVLSRETVASSAASCE